MAWQPPEDELDSNILQQPKSSEDELVKNIPDQWSPPKDELVKNTPDQWSPPEDELDNSPTKIKDASTLQQMKQSGQELTREQERILFDAEDKKDFTQKASEAITTFVPTGIEIAKQLGTGAGEFLYKGVLKPIDAISQSPEEAEKTLKEAKNTWRSGVSGVFGDIQETSDAVVRFSMFGSSITDKLLGKSNDERFEKYMLREGMRQFAQKVYADDPDNAARLLAENPLLQKLASAAALAQGATPEEAELAKKAYEELVKEQGLTKDEINENVSMLGEMLSPISLPGTNRITNTFAKATGKVTRKAGELALKGVVAPLAKGVAKTAGGLESGIEKIQGASRKIGEYAVGDPDTFVKTATNTIVGPAKLPAKMTRGIATTIGDVAGQAGQGRRGMFELAGRAPTSGELTKKLFGPQAMGGKGRARVADWAVRQSNAIIQPAVNGAVLNVALGLPDIETARDLGYSAGVGAGIGAYGGARLAERAGALIDSTTGLAEKIDAIVTPDPSQLRKDEDADIQRFIKTADPTLMSSIDELSNVNNIKSALDLKIKNLEAKKVAQINKDDERRIQDQIDNFTEQRKALDKSTPQTEAEIKRQVQLSFTDAMDLAKTTGAAAGLNNIQVKVLRPDQMEDFYRNLYGKTLTDAESVVQQLVGNPRLSPSEKEMLGLADQTIKQYLQDVAGSSTARGFAISEQTGKPNHLKMQNQTGATVVINGDLVTQMGRDGLNLGRVINHEMQHALSNFQEVRDMIAPIRKELFDQKILNPDGTFEVVKRGVIPDSELDKFALQYAAAMDASGGASFLSNFANQDQLRNYMKEEYLSELAGLSGGIQGNLRSNLDSVGRSVVDWIESRTKNGALKRVKEALRNYGVIVDDQGQFSSVIGGELNPEALAMMRQYQRGLRDLNESLVYNSDPVKDEAEIPLTVFSTNRALQQRYKDSEFFEQQQVVKMTTPDGQTQEIVIPPNVKVDSFISNYRFANGELVDELGNVISLGPDIPLQAMPDGTSLSVDTRIARNADGSPRILSPRESKRRAKKRGEAIRKAIDEAPEDASGVRLEDTGNGNYRGTLSPTQVAAINALPNDLVAPSLKRKIAFFNEILGRKDGSIVDIEYQAAIRDKNYRALQPQMRTEIPFGFQFDKQGNFLMTTMSMSRMHDKANAWAAKRPRNLRLWGGDMTKFWDSVRQYLYNHKQGLQGHIGLNPDPEIAMEMKNRINDLFNVYRKETRDANPDRTTLPKRKGQDSRDVVIRSRRMDRINSYDETALAKMPFSYELAVKNYLPAENPLAELQSPEQFAQAMEIDTELARIAAQGNIEPLELQLHQQDLLHPAEYIDVENGKLRVRSMFDPTQAILEPMESEPEVSASATQFMPAETERYPTSERGFYSGLQKTIDEKVQGKFASPEQLKATFGEYIATYIEEQPDGKDKTIVLGRFPVDLKGKAQDAIANKNKGMVAWQSSNKIKEEELKWSNVLGEIDRLAAENQGKVPKDKVMDYLRNEGAVKFEEVTLGQDNSIQKIADEYRIKIEDEYGEKAFYDEFDEPIEFDELPIRLQDAIEQGKNVLEPKHSTYQLPGGTNYREVVMTMPFKKSKLPKGYIALQDINGEWGVFKSPDDGNIYGQGSTESQAIERSIAYLNTRQPTSEYDPTYTSSHFPETPNYVAHMRINERTDAQGNKGDFIEEFQSDRHQQAREKGYREDIPKPDTSKWRANKVGIEPTQINRWRVYSPDNPLGALFNANSAEEAISSAAGYYGLEGIPDAPFRKDWSIQLFKRALRDAVDSGKSWIGWTTGIEQVKRYEEAMRQAVDEITWNTPKGYQKAFAAIKDGNTVLAGKINEDGSVYDSDTADANGKQLSEVLGKEVASKILAENSGTATGDDLTVGGEGMKGFYDQILPKEIGKYVGKMGGKVEKSEIAKSTQETIEKKAEELAHENGILPDEESLEWLTGRDRNRFIEEAEQELNLKPTPIWRVDITPEMAGKVRGGQLQFMPAEGEEKSKISPKIDTDYLAAVERGDMEIAQRMVDEAERIEAENNFEVEYGSKIFGEYPQASKVIKRLDGTLKDHVPVPVAMLQTGINGNKYYVRALMVRDDNGIFYGFYNDRKERTQVIRNSFENFGVWDDPLARDSYLEIAELIAKKAKYPAKKAKFKDFAIDWWATQGDIQQTAKLKDFIEWEFLDNEIGEVKVRRGTPTAGWNKAATKAGYKHLPIAKFKDGTEIIINTGDKSLFTHPSDLFASLIHEAVHLIQAKEGRFYKSLGDDPNYYSNNIEKEARDAVATIPLLEWAENNLGDYIPGKSNINHPHSIPPAASPVTYDDAGNVIPLSQRFQTTSPDIRFMPAEQPTEYESISARIRPLEGLSAPTKVVGAKGLSLGEIEPPVRGKAMLPDMELTPTISEKPKSSEMIGATTSEKSIQSSDINTSAKPAPDAVIKPFSNALVSSAGLINFLPAYHGTPHEVDKFKLEKIGTGEGAQAYGWGLYFAQKKGTATSYRDKLTPRDRYTIKGMTLDQLKDLIGSEASYHVWDSISFTSGNLKQAKESLARWKKELDLESPESVDKAIEFVKTLNENDIKQIEGNLYKVDLDVKDEDLLDWDKPLSGQSDKIRENVLNESKLLGDLNREWNGNDLYKNLVDEYGGEKQASEYLNSIGIPGIRYLDGTSRNKGEGTYNYVVFDENLIKILDKNDKPVQDELPRATGLQFMPAEREESQEISIPDAILKGSGEFAILRQSLEGKKPSVQEREKEQIPVAKTDTEEESSDSSLISTGVDVPESVDEQSNISNALTIANSQSWRKGRDFKLEVQNRVLEAAKKAGVQISERTAEAIEYLARVGLKDGLLALDQNPNAIGWYDEKTKQALGVMSLLFPEIATDQNARFAFTWAMAVTSNGLKVDKNFELAERVYREFRKTGKMPTNIEAGQAQKAINEGLDLFNKLTKDWGVDNTRKFMQTDFTVGEISRLSKELSPGGEFSDTNVRGSAILGPKIGNGFFSNLYGMFDALTMDRWLVRTWGRWTGTLVEFNPELTELAKNRLQETINNLTPEDKARMDAMIKNDISQMGLEYLSLAIQKASMKPEMRQLMNTTTTGEEFRKAGNGYAKYLDGQKEAPSGPTERNFIREIFGLMLDELKSYPKYKDLTMADLQAVLWYAEKRLYETAKIKSDQDSLDSSDADGYEDDDAPDYANAAIGVARKKGVTEKKIQQVLENIKNDRTTTTRPETIEGNQLESEQQKSAGGFVGKEKQKFKQYVAVTTARRNRTGNEAALWTYARRSGSDGSNAGVLKPKSKKNLGVKYISEWKPGRKLATMFRNNELPPVKFLELDSTDKASAQKFADTIQQSKESSLHGASVYVYPTEDYQGMNLFLSDSGRSGFAVKPDGDIVSVFSMEKGSGRSIMEAAIAAGGKKLDAFDTILPEFYGEHGFIEAARIPWNDEFAPDGWDKQTFKKYNDGEPDVVMMVLDPKFEGEYEPRTDVYTTEYDQAVKMQNSMLRKIEKKRK